MTTLSDPGADERTWVAAARSRLAPFGLAAFATVALAVSSWPWATLVPVSGLDSSWVIGLNLGFHEGLDYGRDVVFTYGPLGFLEAPVAVFPWPLRLSFLWLSVLHVALAGTLLWSMRKGFRSWWVAIPLAFFLLGILTDDPALTVGFTGAVALIAGLPRTARDVTLLSVPLGVLAAIQSLGKLSVGVALVGVLTIAAATAQHDRRRAASGLGAGFLGTAGAAWIVTGQSITAIPAYIAGAITVTSGYASGMIALQPNVQLQFWAAGGLAVLGTCIAWRAGTGLPRRSRTGLVLAWLLLWFVAFKAGFVRHDRGHVVRFTINVLAGLTAFSWSITRRDMALLVAAAPVALYFAVSVTTPGSLLKPESRTMAYADQFAIVADGSRTNDEIAAGRARIVSEQPLDAQTLDAIKDRHIAIDPWEISIAYGHRIPWNPLPVIQTYTAYTKALDDRNADRLADPARGPERILRHSLQAIDGRNPVWDSPAAIRSMLCHYRQTASATGPWQVLERTANRCGPPHEVRAVEARLGQAIAIPAAPAGSLMYVDVDGFGLGAAEKLRKLLYRSVTRTVVLDGNRASNIPPEIAGDGLLLRVPSSADYSPAPFALDLKAGTISFNRGTGKQAPDRITVRFMAAPIRP